MHYYPYPGWPYAAKAVIQHEFDIDHLNIWITFAYPMKQNAKPSDSLWLVYADTILKAVSVSAWQDDFTMFLTVPDIVTLPDRVEIVYNGPSTLLTTAWLKQWEPWGKILSLNITT